MRRHRFGRLPELVDGRDLKSLGLRPCGFDSHSGHHIEIIEIFDLPSSVDELVNFAMVRLVTQVGRFFRVALPQIAACSLSLQASQFLFALRRQDVVAVVDARLHALNG